MIISQRLPTPAAAPAPATHVVTDRLPRRESKLECPRQESNLHPALRRRVLYPLSYEGAGPRSATAQPQTSGAPRSADAYPAFIAATLTLRDAADVVWYSDTWMEGLVPPEGISQSP